MTLFRVLMLTVVHDSKTKCVCVYVCVHVHVCVYMCERKREREREREREELWYGAHSIVSVEKNSPNFWFSRACSK